MEHTNSEIERLARLVAPPTHVSNAVDWAAIELESNTSLPADYKELIDSYGLGSFDGFLWVHHPTTTNPYLNLRIQHEQTLRGDRQLLTYDDSWAPYDLSTECGLLLWGSTDNGDACYWMRQEDSNPETWRVVIRDARAPLWIEFDGGVVAFIHAILSGSFVCEIFPDDFPAVQHFFTSSPVT